MLVHGSGAADGEELGRKNVCQEMTRVAEDDPMARKRAQQLRVIFTSSTAPGKGYVVPVRSEFRAAACAEAQRRGLETRDKKVARKCSGPGCEKAEGSLGEFRVCAACRLAVYCGRGKKLSQATLVRPTW